MKSIRYLELNLPHREAIEHRPDEDELGEHPGEYSKLQEAHTEKIRDLTGNKYLSVCFTICNQSNFLIFIHLPKL